MLQSLTRLVAFPVLNTFALGTDKAQFFLSLVDFFDTNNTALSIIHDA